MKQDSKWRDAAKIPDDINLWQRQQLEKQLDVLETEPWLPVQKMMAAKTLINKAQKPGQVLKKADFNPDSLLKNPAYEKLLSNRMAEDLEAFRLSSLISVVTATLVIYFIGAVSREAYVMSFGVDAMVACVAAVMLVRNLQSAYKIATSYGLSKDFLLQWILGLVLALLLKIILPPYLDFSLFIFIAVYFITRQKLKKVMERLEEN